MSERRGGGRGRPGDGWEDAEPYTESAGRGGDSRASEYDDAAYPDQFDDSRQPQDWDEDWTDEDDWDGNEAWDDEQDADWDEPAAAPAAHEPSAAALRARARRRRALATLAVLGLALFFAFWWAYSYYRASDEPTVAAKPAPTCQRVDPNQVTPEKVTVNVFNATNRKGLAGATAKTVQGQGFQIGSIGNDPLKKQMSGPGEVRFGGPGTAGADLVMKALGSGGVAVDDKRTTAEVDLVLGNGFTKLDALPKPTSTLPACPSASPTK